MAEFGEWDRGGKCIQKLLAEIGGIKTTLSLFP